VLREGNSDRRAPAAVKEYARKHPHPMGEWSGRLEDPRRHMARRLPLQRAVGDRRPTATTCASSTSPAADGEVTVLKDRYPLQAGEVIDAP
jgi:isocitrate dehydrogenase